MRYGDTVELEGDVFIVEIVRKDKVLVYRRRDNNDIRLIKRSDFELSGMFTNHWREK